MEIHIPDNKQYERALGILYRMGGIFRTRPTHVLIVGPGQYQALIEAGVVAKNGAKNGDRQYRGKKKKAV